MEDVAVRRRLGRRRAADPQELVLAVVSQHADSLLRVARRHTHSQADAEDAYQRALEAFVRAAPRLDPATAHRWLHTVVKHEAWAVAQQAARVVPVEGGVAEALIDDGRHAASVEERSERFDDLARAAEALRRLKPQEVRALVLKAQGLSYKEIAEREAWTYTKVNRCLTEGRKAFLARYAGIQSGAECERWLPVLSAIADGEATAEQLVDARPHLRNCPGCRAMVGEMRRSAVPVAALLPPVVLAGGGTAGGGLLDRFAELVAGAQERVVAPVARIQHAVEAASTGKVAAVAASTVALAGGGVAVERHAGEADARPPERTTAVEASTTPDPAAFAAPPPTEPSPAALAAEQQRRRSTAEPDRSTPPREPRSPDRPSPDGAEFAPEVGGAPDPDAATPRSSTPGSSIAGGSTSAASTGGGPTPGSSTAAGRGGEREGSASRGSSATGDGAAGGEFDALGG